MIERDPIHTDGVWAATFTPDGTFATSTLAGGGGVPDEKMLDVRALLALR